MGMAATQARFLSLTARKSNVEFQGQQINQQRTTLSNESASYYSELCNMVVPTPPSIDNYTKISYTFNDGAMTNTITTMLANPKRSEAGEKPYLISYVQQWEDDYAPVEAASSFISKNNSGFYIGNTQLRLLGEQKRVLEPTITIDGKVYNVAQDENGKPYATTNVTKSSYDTPASEEDINNAKYYSYNIGTQKIDGVLTKDELANADLPNHIIVFGLYDENETDPNKAIKILAEKDGNYYIERFETTTESLNRDLTEEELNQITIYDKISKEDQTREEAYRFLLNEKYNNNDQNGQWYVRYVKDSQTGTEVPYFYNKYKLENQDFASGYATTNCYTIGTTTRTKEVVNAPGTVERDSSGRYISITLFEKNSEGQFDQGITYTLTTNTITDEKAYNDALNEYNYQQAQYDKKVQDINSKLEIVQQQDKSLELNLKQLDTEEQAINTEMEAVQKVISKNVSDTFGTFKATG